MDTEYLKEMLVALKREFSRFRAVSALVFAVVLIGVICAGMFWPKAYETDALIYIDSVNVIEPLLTEPRYQATKINRAELAKKLLNTRRLLTETARQTGMLNEESTAEDVDRVVKKLRQSIEIEAEGENYFRVSYWDKNPERSYAVVNNLIQTFIGNRNMAKQSDSSSAFDFISTQVASYKQQMAEAERKLQEHKANSPGTTEAAVKARIATITADIQDLRIAIQQTQSKIATTKGLLNEENQYLSVQTEAWDLQQRKRDLKTELDQLRLSYQDSYPDIVSIKQQMAEIDAALASMNAAQEIGISGKTGEALFDELRMQLSIAEVDLKSQNRRLQGLQGLLEEEYKRADEVAESEAELQKLQRDYDLVAQVYEELRGRQEGAKLSVALNTAGSNRHYEIIEEPIYPVEPGGPQFVHFAVAAPILGLGAPFGLLIALIMVDPRIRSVTNLVQAVPVDLELIGVIPHFESPAEKRRARAEIAMLAIFCGIAIIAYGFLVYAGFTGLV